MNPNNITMVLAIIAIILSIASIALTLMSKDSEAQDYQDFLIQEHFDAMLNAEKEINSNMASITADLGTYQDCINAAIENYGSCIENKTSVNCEGDFTIASQICKDNLRKNPWFD